jgi:Spx/MgsR family transcriptional regulator
MIEVYGIKNCGSVKKAIAFFKEHKLEYRLHDFKSETVSCEKIENWLTQTTINILLNTKGTTYKTLKLKELALDEAGQKEWLCKENMLIKRPVVVNNGTLLVGYNEDIYIRSFL